MVQVPLCVCMVECDPFQVSNGEKRSQEGRRHLNNEMYTDSNCYLSIARSQFCSFYTCIYTHTTPKPEQKQQNTKWLPSLPMGKLHSQTVRINPGLSGLTCTHYCVNQNEWIANRIEIEANISRFQVIQIAEVDFHSKSHTGFSKPISHFASPGSVQWRN